MCGRHAFGDQYRATDIIVPTSGKLELVFSPDDNSGEKRYTVHNFEGPGVSLGMYNTDQVGVVWACTTLIRWVLCGHVQH